MALPCAGLKLSHAVFQDVPHGCGALAAFVVFADGIMRAVCVEKAFVVRLFWFSPVLDGFQRNATIPSPAVRFVYLHRLTRLYAGWLFLA